jgi:hypothetical protein
VYNRTCSPRKHGRHGIYTELQDELACQDYHSKCTD